MSSPMVMVTRGPIQVMALMDDTQAEADQRADDAAA
jgi:hypothetical protein